MPVIAAMMPVAAVYVVRRYYKLVPIITIDDKTISFNEERFPLVDLQKVELTGRRNLPIFGRFMTEAATLYLNDGQTRLIYDDMYENSWELKLYLKQVVIDKENYNIPVNIPIEWQELDNETLFSYKGNPVFSYYGMFLWSMIAIAVCSLFILGSRNTVWGALFFIAVAAVWYFRFSEWMYYFEVSDRFIVIKNHSFVWKKHVYRLDDIREIVFEPRQKAPVYLRLITKDFKNGLYPGGTLDKNTWLELKNKLESNKVMVRDECFQKA